MNGVGFPELKVIVLVVCILIPQTGRPMIAERAPVECEHKTEREVKQ